jgi:hypothetical protein
MAAADLGELLEDMLVNLLAKAGVRVTVKMQARTRAA